MKFCWRLKNSPNSMLVKCFKANGLVFSSLCSIKNAVLFGCHDHNVYCLQCEENYPKLFTVDIGCPISTTPCTCVVNDRHYFVVAGNTGKVHLFDLETQVLLDSLQLPGDTFSSPLVSGNEIYVGCRDNYLYCIEMESN